MRGLSKKEIVSCPAAPFHGTDALPRQEVERNQTEAAKSFTLKIDFLDKAGRVVTSQTVEVGPVEPKRSKSFKAEGVGAGIVAFRYAPLS